MTINTCGFEHLILLIGTNPLPNFVTVRYFLQYNLNLRNIWLVHSEDNKYQSGTSFFAENLRILLKKSNDDLSCNFIPLINLASDQAIKRDLESHLLKKADKSNKFHLNYTGGTKTMAVHAYSFLKENFKDRISFSYLDARSYRLIWDESDDCTDDLREKVKISLDDLLFLHGYKMEDKNKDGTKWDEAVSVFGKIISKNELKKYLLWCKSFLRKVYWDEDSSFIETVKKFKENIIKKHIHEKIKDFNDGKYEFLNILLKSIPPEHSLVDDNNKLWIPDDKVTNKVFYNRLKPSVKDFLDGKWLEHYVVGLLQGDECLSRNKIYFLHSLEAYKAEQLKPLEIDIALIYGYQLIGISITTGDKEDECKLKAFEILHRVNQIGGEESKAMQICCLPDEGIDNFENDIRMVTGSSEEKFKATGIGTLKKENLLKEIRGFICQK